MESSQYHHYIPRFILRNFAHQPLSQGTDSKKRARRKQNKQALRAELVWLADLAVDPPQILERPLSKVFGEQDLYRDITRAVDQHRLEKQLGNLESRAGEIISKIRKDFEEGCRVVSFNRATKDILRKFLFIMKYRGPTQYKRYRHESIDSYCSNDKAELRKYMELKGFKRPIDVWFHNIQTILELKLDSNCKSLGNLSKKMYPSDALWFTIHLRCSYLAICTPSDPEDEFLLSANLFGVHEGPVSWKLDSVTGVEELTCYTEYHILNVIHPRIVLVLRSTLLPTPDEDLDPIIAQWRKELLDASRLLHNSPSKANSMLSDLPVTKALNSYSKVTATGIILRQGNDLKLKSTDLFNFKYFAVSHSHVEKINAIILENGHFAPIIACRSKATFQNSLESYLSMDLSKNDENTYGLKEVRQGTARYEYFQKLVQIARYLGSKVRPQYQVLPFNMEDDSIFDALGETLSVNISESATDFQMLYVRLGK